VPADEIKHLFIRYRANQHRGVTWFAPVLTDVKMFDGYRGGACRARVAAAKMGFIVTKDPMNAASGIDPEDDPETERLTEAAPARSRSSRPGRNSRNGIPASEHAAFNDFTKVILRGIVAGLGLSYIALTGDLEGVSYSSIRWGVLPSATTGRRFSSGSPSSSIVGFISDWISMALSRAHFSSIVADHRDYSNVDWKPRGWAWVDPLKDIQAAVLGIQHGMDSSRSALDEQGVDLEETFQNIADEQELADELRHRDHSGRSASSE
jgi:lambda family phage portal protein